MSQSFGHEELDSERYPLYWFGVLAVASIGLLFHLVAAGNYGYFRDELYYLACAKNMAWGFVDQPPLSIFVLKIFTSLFGDSLFAVRLPGFIAGFFSCFVYALIAREIGGSERSQLIASTFPALSPVVAVVTHLYSMNGLDILFSGLVVLTFLRARLPEKRSAWIIFGVVLGLALLNKLSALLIFAALGISLILTTRRRELVTWQPWTGLLLAALIVSPYIIWSAENQAISLEFIQNATQHKMLPVPPLQFVLTQIVAAGPIFFLITLVGIWYGLNRVPLRPITLSFITVALILIISQKSRENYLAPANALIIPVGAQAITTWTDDRPLRQKFFGIILFATSFLSLLIALPILPVQTLANVLAPITKNLPSAEQGPKSPIQGHADMFGWPEMTAEVESIWESLPPDLQSKTPVFGANYGESSAIYHFRKNKSMSVIGRHNNWWLWGPKNFTGESLIVVGNLPPELQSQFKTYKIIKRLNHKWAVPEEATAPIAHAQGLKISVNEFWQLAKLIQ